MKKIFALILFSMIAFNAVHAEFAWDLSDDGTLTISGTDIRDHYSPFYSPWYSQRNKIKKVIIKNGVPVIGENSFRDCSALTSIIIPNSVTQIRESAFYDCSSLTSIAIPNSVTSIGGNAFALCTSLTSVTIPNSVTSIGAYAFWQCVNLTSITIPESVTYVDHHAFYGCSGLTSVSIGMEKIPKSIFQYCSNLASVTILYGVTSLGMYAFSGCSGLTSIIIPSSVTSIEHGAFSGCTKLTSVTNLSKTPQKIDDYTFGVYGTLHVLPGCKSAYGTAIGWRNFTIVEDATTGIDVVEGTPTISSDKIFSISGQQFDKTKKGLNIINGKKILMK